MALCVTCTKTFYHFTAVIIQIFTFYNIILILVKLNKVKQITQSFENSRAEAVRGQT